MMMAQGYDVVEYANQGSEANASEHVTMLTADEFDRLYGNRSSRNFHGDDATIGTKGHQLFESRLIPALRDRVRPHDIICHPFGHAHSTLYAWMHYHQGKDGRNGENYEWVIPNYFDTSEWEPSFESGDYLAFLGRITPLKGLDTIKALADYSPWKIRLAGQGDPSPWEHPNIEYVGPLKGKERSTFLRNARACLMPTIFTEPFGGSGVEGMLCGTPLISVDYGAFTETVIEGVTGFRCHTLQDWVHALHNAGGLDRKRIHELSAAKYSLDVCGKKYARVFSDLDNLWDKGWYTLSA